MMPQNSPYTFEICAETPAAVEAAAVHADRIELCSALDLGGLTPDVGLMECAAAVGVETHVLIRPRSGDFGMSRSDIAAATAAIRAVRALGLRGVVIGAQRGGALDRRALEVMMDAAQGLDVTLHRVVDVVDDPLAAVAEAIDLGVGRILTSGGARAAADGIEGLNRMQARAAGRVEIMAGSGITSANLRDLMAASDVTSFHASCSRMEPLLGRYADLGFGQAKRVFDPREAERLAAILGNRAHGRPAS